MFQDVSERAGLGRDWAPRDLRRTFVALLSDGGMAIEKIARLVGHASSQLVPFLIVIDDLQGADAAVARCRGGWQRIRSAGCLPCAAVGWRMRRGCLRAQPSRVLGPGG
jgi:hypothetical protein